MDHLKRTRERQRLLAVKGMLPKNSIGRQSATRLKVFAGENHNHQAQKPENWEK